MRVCHVITKPELGGAQLSTLNILSNLPRNNYDVYAITSSEGILGSEFSNTRNVRTYFLKFFGRPINPIADIIAFMQIYNIYTTMRFSLVHTHSSKAGILGRLAAWLARVPVIVHTVHGWPFNDYQNPLTKRLFMFLERVTAKITTRIICVSQKDIEIGLKYKIASIQKFVFIKYGIDLANFSRHLDNRLQKKNEIGINNNDPIVGMISCLKPQKSPLDYVKACIKIYEGMPKVNFLLVGDGVLRKRCEMLLSNSLLNGRFIFTGWRRDVSEILDILDVVVLTSKWEGMPIAIIEALCKGCPVVITDVGGARELVEDGVTGFLVRPGLYTQVAEKVLEVLKDKERSIKMGQNAALSIDDSFDSKNMVDTVDSLYRGLL